MKPILYLVAAGTATAISLTTGIAAAQVAGKAVQGVTVTEMQSIISGWSARRDMLGKDVYNDANQKIGKLDDIIITSKDTVSYAIVGTGGFLGMAKHDVAIPINQIKNEANRIVLPGATKDALKAMPPFEYARK